MTYHAVSKTPINSTQKILAGFTKKERESLNEYFRKKFSLVGRQTSSKTVSVISDMHVGSTTALYSGYGPAKITPDQEKLRDWWVHCSDEIGRCDLLLLNGEPIEGTHYKSSGFELWSPDIGEQILDSERLVKQWKYDKLLLTRGSKYHSQDNGHTSYEEMLARKMGAIQYQGLFGQGLILLQKQKQLTFNAYTGNYTDYYVFFQIHNKLFHASHELGFSRQKASRSGAIARELVNMELERGKWYDAGRNLDCLIRSHNHYYAYCEFANSCGIVNSCFKMPDSHLHHGAMAIYPDIGCTSVIVEPNSDLIVRKHIMPKERLSKPRILRI
jgi:hypothetical protein